MNETGIVDRHLRNVQVRSRKRRKKPKFPDIGARPDVIGRRVEPLVAMMDA